MTSYADAPDLTLQHAVEQFYYEEAALLDSHRYDEWIALMAPDIRYVMPGRATLAVATVAEEFPGPGGAALFDEDFANLRVRIKRLKTGKAWAAEPRSRTRHMIHNVRIRPATTIGALAADERADEIPVASNFFVYRSRLERQVDLFVGAREDILRPGGSPLGWRIARRNIYLDQTMLLANNLSLFF